MLLGQKIKELRLENGVLQRQLASLLEIDTPMFSKIERGNRRAKRAQVIQIANYFNVSVDYLLGNDVNNADDTKISNLIKIDNDKMVKIPVSGVIKAGIPMLAEENIIDFEYVHQEELQLGEEYFYLQIKGDSMINASIKDGSRVLIKKQNFIENDGDIMAVRVNGDEATLKRVYRQQNGLVLQSENPKYAPMFYPASDVEVGYVSIIGRAIKVEIKL